MTCRHEADSSITKHLLKGSAIPRPIRTWPYYLLIKKVFESKLQKSLRHSYSIVRKHDAYGWHIRTEVPRMTFGQVTPGVKRPGYQLRKRRIQVYFSVSLNTYSWLIGRVVVRVGRECGDSTGDEVYARPDKIESVLRNYSMNEDAWRSSPRTFHGEAAPSSGGLTPGKCDRKSDLRGTKSSSTQAPAERHLQSSWRSSLGPRRSDDNDRESRVVKAPCGYRHRLQQDDLQHPAGLR